MKIHDEMSQISVPEDLDEKTYQSILSAEKTVQKNRFRKKCAWSVLSCLVIIFGIIHVANPAMAENILIWGEMGGERHSGAVPRHAGVCAGQRRALRLAYRAACA